jgi:ankyrin repeat protein
MMRLLLEKGAELESKDKDGRTSLPWAAANGHEVVVKLLLEKGTELESKNNNRQAPLSLAPASEHEVVVKLLLEKDAENSPCLAREMSTSPQPHSGSGTGRFGSR